MQWLHERTKSTMPKCGRGCGSSNSLDTTEGAQLAGSIAPDNHALCAQILHRKTKGVKLNGTIIVWPETINRNRILIMFGVTKTF